MSIHVWYTVYFTFVTHTFTKGILPRTLYSYTEGILPYTEGT